MRFGQRERGNFSARNARQVFLLLLFRAKQEQRLRDADGLMRGDESGHVSVPAAEQDRGASVIILRQTETAVLLRYFDSERADLRESLKIFWWNFAGPINFVRVDMITQITFELAQQVFPGGAIFGALRRPGINPIEIVAPDEKIARKTAAVIQWIARGFGQLECFALAFRHLRRVDRTGCGLCRLGAGFRGNLFFGSLEGRLH